MINNEKRENLGKVEGTSELKHKPLLSTRLVEDRHRPAGWAAELSIPLSWIEGCTRTYVKTSVACPKSKNFYTLEITYALESGNSCTARFGCEDAFHWQARPKSPA